MGKNLAIFFTISTILIAVIRREEIKVKGIVQGVGFRPFIYSLASKYNLNGFVLNNAEGVVIEVEGEKEILKKFILDIEQKAPPLSRIEKIQTKILHLTGYKTFIIKSSRGTMHRASTVNMVTLISADITICKDCVQELFDTNDRRFSYPFINCTNCGPRFTIIKDIPYDRDKTTMNKFKMCFLCQKEYDNPLDRRFHAQPNACPDCGPQVKLINNIGATSIFQSKETEAIKDTIELLKQGKIVAIKGLGGFHLACDAQNQKAVATLRAKKYREEKPFAVMAKNMEVIKSFCLVNKFEEKLLLSEKRPIVLLRKKGITLNPSLVILNKVKNLNISFRVNSAKNLVEDSSLTLRMTEGKIADGVAPKQKYYGVMLPYTPLHHLLFLQLSILVMTSGNISDEPISYKNEETLAKLKDITDYFLINDREIYMRCDDSVTRCFEDKEMILRRARGYVPEHIKLPVVRANGRSPLHILSCGAELKNTFCLARDNYAFVSHHIGDLENIETLTSFEQGIEHFKNLFYINPTVIAYDLHPEYLSTKYAKKLRTLNSKLLTVGIQHHHAHIASCMAENGITQKVIGVAFDGLGYGDDNTLWGGEFFVADFSGFKRVAHFKYIQMPGGTQAIKEPYRMAISYLYQIYGDNALDLGIEFTNKIDKKRWNGLISIIDKHINSPIISSVGRLFDAVSSLIGTRDKVNYEGQAAIELEMIADENCTAEYSYEINPHNSGLIIDPSQIFFGIIEDLKSNKEFSIISAKFHNTIANIIKDVALQIRERLGLNEVALSGGVFQNMLLLQVTLNKLRESEFRVYTHHKVPSNDGGISLGQTVIANAKINKL